MLARFRNWKTVTNEVSMDTSRPRSDSAMEIHVELSQDIDMIDRPSSAPEDGLGEDDCRVIPHVPRHASVLPHPDSAAFRKAKADTNTSASRPKRSIQRGARKSKQSGSILQGLKDFVIGRSPPRTQGTSVEILRHDNKMLQNEVQTLYNSLTRQKQDSQSREHRLVEDKDRALKDAKAAHRRCIGRLQSDHDAVLKNLKSEHTQQAGEMKQHYQQQLSQSTEERDLIAGEHQSLILSNNSLQQEASLLARENDQLIAEREQIFATQARLQQEIKELSQQYDTQIDRLQRDLSSIQDKALQCFEPERWAPFQASDVEHRMRALVSSIRQWSERFADVFVDQLLEPDCFTTLSELLTGAGCITSAERFRMALRNNSIMQKPGRAAAFAASAFLSFEVFRKIVCDPFFAFVGTEFQHELLQSRCGDSLRGLQSLISSGRREDGEAVRIQLLRFFGPKSSSDNNALRDVKLVWKLSGEAAAKQFVSNTALEVANILVRSDMLPEAEQELLLVAKEAAQLSQSLWTRKTCVEMSDYRSIAGATSMTFKSDAEAMDPHRFHTRDLADDPRALDDSEVIVLCCPLVALADNAEGKRYDQKRAVNRAEAWMG